MLPPAADSPLLRGRVPCVSFSSSCWSAEAVSSPKKSSMSSSVPESSVAATLRRLEGRLSIRPGVSLCGSSSKVIQKTAHLLLPEFHQIFDPLLLSVIVDDVDGSIV